MKVHLAFALLVATAAAVCDPSEESCVKGEEIDYTNAPSRWICSWWAHGIMSYILAINWFILMGAFYNGLKALGTFYLVAAFTIATLNFCGFLPSAIIWTLSAIDRQSLTMHAHYYKALRYTNYVSVAMGIINFFFWFLLILFVEIPGFITFETGYEAPSVVIPSIGISLEFLFQITYAFTYGYNLKILYCWSKDWPEFGSCDPVMGGNKEKLPEEEIADFDFDGASF